MSQEELRAFQMSVMEERIAIFKALTEKFGPGVLDVITERVSGNARKQMEAAPIEDRSLQGVINNLWAHLDDTFAYTTEEQTDTKLRFKVTRCPLIALYKAYNVGEIGYAFHCTYDFGFCEGLNPKIKFTRTKTLMMGDDCCDHTYELTEE